MLAATTNQILQGVLLGGLYAMFAMGLSLSVGVMRFVNIAHGDLIVAMSFLLLTLTTQLGLSPFVAVAIAIPVAFAAGYLLQRLLFQRVLGKNVLADHSGDLRPFDHHSERVAGRLRRRHA